MYFKISSTAQIPMAFLPHIRLHKPDTISISLTENELQNLDKQLLNDS